MKKPSLNTILLIGITALSVLQLKSCHDRTPLPEKMIRNEERLKYLEEKRLADSVALVETRGRYDSLITNVLSKGENDFQNKYQPLKRTYEKIPHIVDNLDKQQLRQGAESY